ncbi:MAG: 3-dehydroquinate synthase [Eubacteriaceae bacterium]
MRDIKVKINRTHNYSIMIKKGILDQLDILKNTFFKYEKAVIISDENVSPIYLKHISKQIKNMGCKMHEIIVEVGEKSKSLEQVQEIYQHFLEYNITRSDVIIALGGGIVGDLTGYCASTYLRGVDFIQIPTSLLAQVDSSVGGKVGVNLSKGKNLVGSFYQPKVVIIDPKTLDTLPSSNFAEGMAEVIKYGCIYDRNLFEKLIDYDTEELLNNIEDIIEKCCTIKKEVVEKDEMEKDLRRILNFGHTLGHVIEAYYNYEKYSHGESVAIGMYCFSVVGEKMGVTKIGTSEKLKKVLIKFNLPVNYPDLDKELAFEIINRDKKFDGNKINLVFLKEIGKSLIISVDKHQLKEYI